MLKACNLKKIYSGRAVVNDVSFHIARGEVVGLLGQNGAGKTTSFDTVVGLVKPDEGDVYLDDKKLNKYSIHQRAKLGVSYLPQEPSAFRKLSVADNLKLFWELQGKSQKEQEILLEDLLNEFDIYHLRKSQAISLSGGERRRLEIARALAQSPDYLLLDEPFTGVDPIAIGELKKIIKRLVSKRNIGILITDHNPRATLSITDRAYIIKEGQVLIKGTAQEIANNPLARQFYLGEDFSLS